MRKIFLILFIILLPANLHGKDSFFSEGVRLFKNKDFNKAKFKFEQDIVYNPKNENSYLYLSKIFNEQKKKELEEKNLKTVILLNPKNEEATFNLVKLKFANSDFEGSKKLVNELLIFCKEFCQKSKNIKLEIEKSLKK